MIKLLNIEWLKLKNYRVFWVLFTLYFLGLLIVSSSGMLLMEYMKSKGAEFKGIDPTILPLYDFPDIWHNMIYIATYFKLFLAFIVIISVTNDINYRTLRQNIIDGLSKNEFLFSKQSLILVLSGLASIFLFLSGLILGTIYSKVHGLHYILQGLEFFPAYFLELCTFLSLAFLLSVLIKKAGFVIVLLFMYTLIFEPVFVVTLENTSFIPDALDNLLPYFPIKSLNNLIQVPFPKYVFMKIQDFVAWQSVLIVSGWLIVYNVLILTVLKRRNV